MNKTENRGNFEDISHCPVSFEHPFSLKSLSVRQTSRRMVHFSHIALKSSRHIRNFGDKRHVYGLPIALMREEMHKWKLETSATDYYQRRGLCLADMLFPQKRRPTLCSWSPPWLRHVISTDTRYLEAYTSRFKPLGHFMRGGAPFPPKYPAPPLILIKVMFCRFLIRWENLFMKGDSYICN